MEVSEIDMLAQEVARLRMRRDDLEDQLKQVMDEFQAAEQRMLEAMIESGKDRWEVKDIGTLSMRTSTYWSIRDNEKLIQYLKTRHPEMIKIHPTTIRGFANEIRENDLAQGEIKDYAREMGIEPYDKISITLRRG